MLLWRNWLTRLTQNQISKDMSVRARPGALLENPRNLLKLRGFSFTY